eukprot:TRINITY_DN2654_c0_g2_i1.p1 TRINITY_DN2654_c0_g2~~TRINITY_DN2654_c0_g2_i1.p1  ORF type:complete len:395 (+),score=131.82 TRINITY_DN2654_c0_g2_i1:39-1223(+)
MCIMSSPLASGAGDRDAPPAKDRVSSGASSEGEPHALQEKGASPLLQTCISTPSPSCATFADGEGRERLKHLLETVSDNSPPGSVDGEGTNAGQGWCNFNYSTCCPFAARHATGKAEKCRFLHLDTYFQMDVEARQAVGTMPNIMHKHMHGLVRDMARALNSRARAVLEAHVVSSVWNNGEGNEAECTVNPYEETVEMLRSLGWVIPPQEPSAVFAQSMKLEDAPYAGDVAAIVQLCARSVQYQVNEVSALIRATISWVIEQSLHVGGASQVQGCAVIDDLCRCEEPCDYDSAIAALSDKHWVMNAANAHAKPTAEMSERQRRRAAYVAKQREKQSAAKALRRNRMGDASPPLCPEGVAWETPPTELNGQDRFMALAQHQMRCIRSSGDGATAP